MALPTGTISFASAGLLRLYVSAKYERSAGAFGAANTADGNIVLRGYCGAAGSLNYSPLIDKYSGATFFELDYPGGSVEWQVGVEQVNFVQPTGSVSIAMRNVRISWELIKR